MNAQKNGYFKKEISVVKGLTKDGKEMIHDKDEGIRPETNIAGLKKLKDLKSL